MNPKIILPLGWDSGYSDSIPSPSSELRWDYRPSASIPFVSSQIILPKYCVHCREEFPESTFEKHWEANPECSVGEAHRL